MPQIRPITDLRNTTEISELCHAKNEPIFITKNGYGDLVIMSMEAYEALTGEGPAKQQEGMCFLTEKDVIWAGMLADVLEQHKIPFAKENSLGAGVAIRTGGMGQTTRFFVPAAYLPAAQDIVDELFSGDEAEQQE